MRVIGNNKKTKQSEIIEYVYEEYKAIYLDFGNKLEGITNEDISEIVYKVPNEFINESHQELVIKILDERKGLILNKIC